MIVLWYKDNNDNACVRAIDLNDIILTGNNNDTCQIIDGLETIDINLPLGILNIALFQPAYDVVHSESKQPIAVCPSRINVNISNFTGSKPQSIGTERPKDLLARIRLPYAAERFQRI